MYFLLSLWIICEGIESSTAVSNFPILPVPVRIAKTFEPIWTNVWNLTACADFPNAVAQRPISFFFGGGGASRGLWPPNSSSAEIFVQCTYPRVSSSYVYSFGSYRVDKQTNKQTDAAENTQRSSLYTLRRWVMPYLVQSLECMDI